MLIRLTILKTIQTRIEDSIKKKLKYDTDNNITNNNSVSNFKNSPQGVTYSWDERKESRVIVPFQKT